MIAPEFLLLSEVASKSHVYIVSFSASNDLKRLPRDRTRVLTATSNSKATRSVLFILRRFEWLLCFDFPFLLTSYLFPSLSLKIFSSLLLLCECLVSCFRIRGFELPLFALLFRNWRSNTLSHRYSCLKLFFDSQLSLPHNLKNIGFPPFKEKCLDGQECKNIALGLKMQVLAFVLSPRRLKS